MFDTQSETASPTDAVVATIDPKHDEALRWLDDRRAHRPARPPRRFPVVVRA